MIKELIEDENMDIRNQVAQDLPRIILLCKPQHEKIIRNIIVLGLEKGPDFIRSHLITSIINLTGIDQNWAVSLLKNVTSIKDWRVRYTICHNIERVH